MSLVYDLCLNVKDAPIKETLKTAYHNGYNVVAVCHTVKTVPTKADICPFSSEDLKSFGSEPSTFRFDTPQFPDKRRRLTVLTRLNIVLPAQLKAPIRATNPAITSYDLVALHPANEEQFRLASKLPVDIVSLDASHQLPFMLKRRTLSEIVESGQILEIRYGPALRTAEGAKALVAVANAVVFASRGRHVSLASDGPQRRASELSHLASTLLGLGKGAITTAPARALRHAASRRVVPCVGTMMERVGEGEVFDLLPDGFWDDDGEEPVPADIK
eukprot:gnl/Dysnectes_brevis/9576_a17930_151.p1 GENE.gnl/Dysnectes_brevis/9576_a17930_151~~gnl/Dysnectes_brevis/9576_a17930_151.p1  ORF type:complete len:274 (+),score=74.95 gnl/Dysnectes_brevis/9576_a17930_151:34-855(+)